MTVAVYRLAKPAQANCEIRIHRQDPAEQHYVLKVESCLVVGCPVLRQNGWNTVSSARLADYVKFNLSLDFAAVIAEIEYYALSANLVAGLP